MRPIRRVGVLGGGQLGWMLGVAAHRLGFETVFLDPAADCPVDAFGNRIRADFDDPSALAEFADRCDVATFEFENVPAASLELLEPRVPVHPGPRSLEYTQDRLVEKRFLRDIGVPVPDFHEVQAESDLEEAILGTGLPAIIKTRRMGYDGKGQARIETIEDGLEAVRTMPGPAIVESMVPFDFEASVLVVRGKDGETLSWPPIANHHEGGILRCSRTPCPALTSGNAERMRNMAVAVADSLEHVGVLAVEFFVRGDEILANEIAPRVHNSGHVTNEFSRTDQFENHIRAVTGMPLGDTSGAFGVGFMFNVIGTHPNPGTESLGWRRVSATGATIDELRDGGATWYDYRKDARPGRKLGHLTVVGEKIDAMIPPGLVDDLPGASHPPPAWESMRSTGLTET